ncbi:MAG: aspartate-semialdehyde dehydrogenase [Chlamydiales bacterium]|jgi:aspartate-semialdehyde dehydrogenase|nr:aspartate-semialdehyde dehydrogenase [Chlamydiales bacterium]
MSAKIEKTNFISEKNSYLSKKIPIAILGATGMVGQHLIRILRDHPWFEIKVIAASLDSEGKTYGDAVARRWHMDFEIPPEIAVLQVKNALDVEAIAPLVKIIFCAIDLDKQEAYKLEHSYASAGVWVTSCLSACRSDPLIPMILPVVNPHHFEIITLQRKNKGFSTGAIITKSNCSIQSYVIALEPLRQYGIDEITVFSQQAISGAGKTFQTWPAMQDNLIPYIEGEEQKSENEPLKVWGKLTEEGIIPAQNPIIKARCVRVGVANGHMAHVSIKFRNPPSLKSIINLWNQVTATPLLPSSPKKPIYYLTETNRPQPQLDVMRENGMAVSIGQLRLANDGRIEFSALAHNAILGAAGGAVWATELALTKGLII